MLLLTMALVGLLAPAPAVAESRNLTLAFSSQSTHSRLAFDEMKRETERLIAPADYSLVWIERNGTAPGTGFEELVMLDFRGACENAATSPPSGTVPLPSLATTALTDGRVLPFVKIECDRVRSVIESAVSGLPEAARQALFGRALGRVLAHELRHVLARTTAHTDSGVSKPCFRLADLLTPRFQFDAGTLATMRPVAPRAREESFGSAGETEAEPSAAR